MSTKSQSFEKALSRLEDIVAKMEKGEVPLEKALSLFEEGTNLVAQCTKLLDEAEMRVTMLGKSSNGELVETEFANDES